MSFDLGLWHEDQPISAKQAAQVYGELCDGNALIVKPSSAIALFLQDLTQRYPPLSAYPTEQVDECPWNCDWDVTPGSVVICIAWSRAEELAPLLIWMADTYNLVCYNPQRDAVYLPKLLLSDCG